MPTNNVEVPPSQPTTNLTTDVLQAFMLTSMKNQAQMTQMMQTLVTNQATMQPATMQRTTMQQTAMQQTTLQGIRDSGTMTVESRYPKDFQRHNPPSFDGGKIDSIAEETWPKAMETTFFSLTICWKIRFIVKLIC